MFVQFLAKKFIYTMFFMYHKVLSRLELNLALLGVVYLNHSNSEIAKWNSIVFYWNKENFALLSTIVQK